MAHSPMREPKRALRRTTERILLEDAAGDAEQEELSQKPGTTASQPSRSMTSTIWLFAVGWNFTRMLTTPHAASTPRRPAAALSEVFHDAAHVFPRTRRASPLQLRPARRHPVVEQAVRVALPRPRTDGKVTAPSSAGRRRRWRMRPCSSMAGVTFEAGVALAQILERQR